MDDRPSSSESANAADAILATVCPSMQLAERLRSSNGALGRQVGGRRLAELKSRNWPRSSNRAVRPSVRQQAPATLQRPAELLVAPCRELPL